MGSVALASQFANPNGNDPTPSGAGSLRGAPRASGIASGTVLGIAGSGKRGCRLLRLIAVFAIIRWAVTIVGAALRRVRWVNGPGVTGVPVSWFLHMRMLDA